MIHWTRRAFVTTLLALTVGFSFSGGCGKSGKPRIVYIAKNTGNPYFKPLIEGFKKAAEEQGFEVDTIAPANADADSQLSIVKDQIQRGVKAIAISPNSTVALNETFKEAMAKGIPVITVDSDLTDNESARSIGVLTADPQLVGESQIELLGRMMGYEGEFAILSATREAPNQNRWIEVMKATLASNPKYAKMKLVETVYGNDDQQKSLTEAELLMQKWPNLRGIIAPTTVGVMQTAKAVKTAGKADRIVVTGLGLPNEMRPYIKDGTVKAFALWNPYDEGYLAGQIAAQLAKGELKPGPGVKFKAGTLGERTIGEKNIVITGPPFEFNSQTIDQFDY